MQSRIIGTTFLTDDVFNKKVLENLELLRSEVLKIQFENIYDIDYLNEDIKDVNYAKLVEKRFVNDFFNGKYNLDYKKFDERSIPADEETYSMGYDGYVIGRLASSKVDKVCIPNMQKLSDLQTCIHEFSHYINFTKCPKMHFSYLHSELPSIFIQMLFVDYAIKNNYFSNKGDIKRFFDLEYLLNYIYCPDFSFDDIKNSQEIPASFDDILEYLLYVYGYVYSNRLYDFYLDDEKKFLKHYMGIYSGNCIEEVLYYYGINMKDEKTVDTTLRLIKRVQEDSSHVK